eukprot:CAMPEP_0194211522 /NCGR_PEP_ID=MMETSP0156-20130528/10506_1 /TAXON_ID=33649 /ORGANISM="Thalassionema nitzschioides, Strain L26-B" /LENGTH=456 /DNA_ID=CAMNT_0038939101 /DNA_START=63 /DNA_END=1433 /DNA_ORIENTATION=+
MSSSPDDDQISQFMAFTGCADGERAQQYLEMANMNLETAVGLFMEHQQHGNGAMDANQHGDATNPLSPQVRAPDKTQTMRLMDDVIAPVGNPYADNGDNDILMNAFSNFDARAAVNAAAAAASADETDDQDDDQETKMEDVSGSLSSMFAAPSNLIHKGGGFQGARAVAKDARRWLLVNLQSDSEFSCHALNRDVWRDELVENLIREGFIFWQAMDDSADGQTYAERYKVCAFPHIAIVDPRTGRSLWKKEGWTQVKPFTAENFAEIAMDFCSRHSFDKDPLPPVKKSATPNINGERKRPFMSENEQMEAAVAASLTSSNHDGKSKGDEDECIMEDDNYEIEFLGTRDGLVEADSEEKKPSFLEKLLSVEVGDEPADGARIQMRMPDATRLVRRFGKNDAVKMIYAFVAQNNDEAKKGKDFMLMAGFPPKDIVGDLDLSIESCGLNGQAVTVRWKD